MTAVAEARGYGLARRMRASCELHIAATAQPACCPRARAGSARRPVPRPSLHRPHSPPCQRHLSALPLEEQHGYMGAGKSAQGLFALGLFARGQPPMLIRAACLASGHTTRSRGQRRWTEPVWTQSRQTMQASRATRAGAGQNRRRLAQPPPQAHCGEPMPPGQPEHLQRRCAPLQTWRQPAPQATSTLLAAAQAAPQPVSAPALVAAHQTPARRDRPHPDGSRLGSRCCNQPCFAAAAHPTVKRRCRHG